MDALLLRDEVIMIFVVRPLGLTRTDRTTREGGEVEIEEKGLFLFSYPPIYIKGIKEYL